MFSPFWLTAIAESGAYQMVSPLPTLSEAETAGSAIATNLGCSTAACLRAVPVAEILGQEGAGAVSIVDGQVLKTGAFNKVPVMNGSNHDEYLRPSGHRLPGRRVASSCAFRHSGKAD
jgi:para-nitrobenzyl esterase